MVDKNFERRIINECTPKSSKPLLGFDKYGLDSWTVEYASPECIEEGISKEEASR